MSATQSGSDLASANAEVRSKWGWFVALGVALLVLGFLAFGNLLAATLASVFFVGAMMIVGAVAQVIHALQVKGWGGFLLWLLSALLYGAAGVLVFANPALAAVTLTLVLAVALIASGALRIVSGVRLRPSSGWGWVVASGVISVLAGVVFLLGWPVNSLWLLGMVLAIDLVFQGVAAIGFGLALKSAR
jgi:uncharacterized membrane protein HdeD (DUF308 family)